MLSKFFGYLCLGAAIVLVLVVLFIRFAPPAPLLFSPEQLLAGTWRNYKSTYLDQTFRTIDKQRGGITTSEGQSYTMLRAVWAGDKDTFDGAWNWTQQNLARPSDHLFSWLWGRRADGSSGILTAENGENTASDADSDIALALLFAYARWQDPAYLAAARAIIGDIWSQEVVVIGGKPYLAADNLEKNARDAIVVNPSYLSPASYHLFAQVDPAHPWENLRAESYVLLRASADASFSGTPSAHLPPDWIRVSRATGAISAATTGGLDTNFGFDALRVPFRVALDAAWFKNPAATALLQDFSFLSTAWKKDGRLASVYTHDGSVVAPAEAAAMYGGLLGYFMYADPESAAALYRRKLTSLYDVTYGSWNTPLSYYDDNWVWFGIALYTNELPNLAAELPASAFSQ